MILQLHTESCHPIFRASSAFEKRDLGSNRHDKKSPQFNENKGNIELPLRTVISSNQLSIYGAIADLCEELNEDSAEDSREDSESSGTFDTEERPHEMFFFMPRIYNALKCKTLTWRRRGNLFDRYVENISNVNDKISNSKEEKTSIAMSIGKLDGGTTESHRETCRQRLHLQHRSGKIHNCRRVGAHGIPDHLRNGDFGFLEGIPENRRVCRKDTRSLYRSVQYSLFTSAERTPRAWLKSHALRCHPCAPEKDLSSGVTHVSSMVVSPAIHHKHLIFLIHSSFYDTRTRSTIGTTRATPRTPSTSRTSPCSLSRQAAPSRITPA